MSQPLAILMTVERVATRASTSEALLTLAVPLEQAATISKFLSMIGQQVGVAFADVSGKPVASAPLAQPEEQGTRNAEVGGSTPSRSTNWKELPPLTQSAIKLCNEPQFQKFVAERLDNAAGNQVAPEYANESECSNYIKNQCRVSTRRDLERVDGARERFGALMTDYRDWQTPRRERSRAH